MGKFPTGHAVTTTCICYCSFFPKLTKHFQIWFVNQKILILGDYIHSIQQVPICSKGLNFWNLLLTQFLKEKCCHAVTFLKNQHGASKDKWIFFTFEILMLLSLGFKNSVFSITCLIKSSYNSHFHLVILTDVTLWGAWNGCILVWAPKLCAQIKEKLMQNNINYLIISSMSVCLHLFRQLIWVSHLKLLN